MSCVEQGDSSMSFFFSIAMFQRVKVCGKVTTALLLLEGLEIEGAAKPKLQQKTGHSKSFRLFEDDQFMFVNHQRFA